MRCPWIRYKKEDRQEKENREEKKTIARLEYFYKAVSDFSFLNRFEQQWVAWYVWIGNSIISTGLMSLE